MQDQDIPPQAGGDIKDAVDVVRQNEVRVARWAATARSIRAYLPLPWITATAPIWAATMATAAERRDGPVFPRPTRCRPLTASPSHERRRFARSSRPPRTC